MQVIPFRPAAVPSVEPPPPPGAAMPHRVLIVEDERRSREHLASITRDLGLETFLAGAAYEAISVAARERPDVIFVDGLLPQMHGFELARFLGSLDADYHPRIVITTAIYKNTRYRNEARLKYGVHDYLIKPLHRADVMELLALDEPEAPTAA